MKTPLQLDIQGAVLSARAKEVIHHHLGKLEGRFGALIACRIAINPPVRNTRLGGRYKVNIHLSLPGGREVNVGTPHRNYEPRHEQLIFALHDTFRKAVRQLQRQIARLRVEPRRKSDAEARS